MVGIGVMPPLRPAPHLVSSAEPCQFDSSVKGLTIVTRACVYGERWARVTNVGIMLRRLWAAMRTHSDRMSWYTVSEDSG
jgi:hypothetical protein